jgi:hypothetical protein
VAALLLTIAAPAIAGGQGRPGARGGGQGNGRGLSPADIQDQFDAYAIVQAQDALQLSDDQYPQFVRRARALHALRRRAQNDHRRLVMQLGEMLRAGRADETRLAAATRAIDDHERASLDETRKARAALDEVLTVRQRARFRLLEEQLERKKLDMLFRARQGARR